MVHELLFCLGHAEWGPTWRNKRWEVGERLVGETKAGETPRQHVKLGPQAHLCTRCQRRSQCHRWAFWTRVMASALFNYRLPCLVMWYICLVLFIPCNLTQRSWAEPKLPSRGGCRHGTLHPGLSTQKGFASIWVSIPAATPYFAISPLLWQQALKFFSQILMGGFVYRIPWKEYGKFKWFWPEDNVYTADCNTPWCCSGWLLGTRTNVNEKKPQTLSSAQSYSALEVEKKK